MTNTAGSLATTVARINGVSLAGLASGVLYNTTSTGVPSIATGHQIETTHTCTTAGTSTAYTCTTSPSGWNPSIADYFIVEFNVTNGASPTLAVNGGTAYTIWYNAGNTQVTAASFLTAAQPYLLMFQGSAFVILSAIQQQNAGTLGSSYLAPTGSGSAIPTGASSTTSQDFVKYNDASGTQADSGVAVTAIPQKVNTCGTTTACANTAQASPRIVWGTVPLVSGTAIVTGMTAWTSTTSYSCTSNDTTAANYSKCVPASTSSITCTGTSTDTIVYHCVGN